MRHKFYPIDPELHAADPEVILTDQATESRRHVQTNHSSPVSHSLSASGPSSKSISNKLHRKFKPDPDRKPHHIPRGGHRGGSQMSRKYQPPGQN